jgi:nitrogen-specific signal transduction histidine kinase
MLLIVCAIPSLLQHDLQINEVSVTTEFQENLPEAHRDVAQLEQILLNLVKNAIEAISSVTSGARLLRLTTSFAGAR